MGKHVLVTGATGMLGRALVTQLQVQGHTVRAMTRREPRQAATDALTWVQADLATGHSLGQALEGIDVVIHAATSPVRHM